MKKKIVERWVLLEHSGELSERKKRILDALPEAHQMREELRRLSEVDRIANPEPSVWVKQKIISRLRSEHRPIWTPARVLVPAAVLAVCFLLAVVDFKPESSECSVAVVTTETDMWSTQFESDLVELENLILAVSDSPLDIMEM